MVIAGDGGGPIESESVFIMPLNGHLYKILIANHQEATVTQIIFPDLGS